MPTHRLAAQMWVRINPDAFGRKLEEGLDASGK
jgi:hypothetical protein